jgi:predicted DNA-binding transcriptional regulator YafY
MRADRLVAALLLLQARGRVTAAELADELEVSVATARRDLEALSAAGIPIYPQAGRGGGWSLVGGARTDLSGLSAAEAQALFLLVGPAAAVSGEAKAALRKLVQALPQTFRSDAEAASAATMIDPARWGEPDRRRPEIVDLLQTAVVRRRKIRLAYVGRTRERTERLVDPWGLVDKDDIWYLVAGTELPAERPEGFTLATAWEQVVGEVERQRSRTWATVLIESRSVWVLRRQFGRHCHPEGEFDDGRTRVRLAAPTPLDIARHLAGWGTGIEVVEPRSVQTELARIGAELASRYGSTGRGSGRGRGGGASGNERRRRDQSPGRVGAVGVEEEFERTGRDLGERDPDGREGDGEPADHRDVVVADE